MKVYAFGEPDAPAIVLLHEQDLQHESCWPAIRRNGLSWSGGLWKGKKEKNDEICAF